MRRDVFQAVSDPTRRAILALVSLQAMTPSALSLHFGSSRQAISKHLRILAECEVVSLELRGRKIYYHLNASKIKEIDTWLENFRSMWETRFDQLDNLLASNSPENT